MGLGEFKRTLETMGTPAESLPQAAVNARDVTQDFSVKGRQVRASEPVHRVLRRRACGYTRLWQAAFGDQAAPAAVAGARRTAAARTRMTVTDRPR